MLHGFADTGDMWAPLAGALARERTVVVPDLRGMGLSSHPEGGYDKKTQGADVARVVEVPPREGSITNTSASATRPTTRAPAPASHGASRRSHPARRERRSIVMRSSRAPTAGST